MRWLAPLTLLILLTGCGPERLETGYQPKALNSSPTMRRSYYASPFSPEAVAPNLAGENEPDIRRPRPGY